MFLNTTDENSGMQFTYEEICKLPSLLSAPRFATYQDVTGSNEAALRLYHWNLELSSAFLVPLHLCEVAVRNSVAVAIESTYGPNWPLEKAFHISLAHPKTGFNPRQELSDIARKSATTSKVISELKFVFWQRMFTSRHDQAIWNPNFKGVFPNCDPDKTIQQLRSDGYEKLAKIRSLRNRIAHHEPIFQRDTREDYDLVRSVIAWTDATAAGWLDKIERVTEMIRTKP